MASNKVIRVGPTAVTNAVTNFFNPPTTTGGVGAGSPLNCYAILRHIRVVNKTAGAVAISLFIGATGASAAGTEFAWSATSVAANSFVEWFGMVRMDVADFLTMLAGANTSLVMNAEGELGIV